MRRFVSLAVMALAGVGLSAGSASAVVVQPASITVRDVAIDSVSGGVILHITNATGWHRTNGDVTNDCTVDASVTGTDSQPYDLTTPDTTNPNANGKNGMLLPAQPTMPTGVTVAPGPITVQAQCELSRSEVVTHTVSTHKIKNKRPGQFATRVVTPLEAGGNCAGHGPDGSGGQVFTCLLARESVAYQFLVGRGAKNLVASHTVTAGLEPCRGKSWFVKRNKTHLRHVAVIFSHGSRNNFSQCDVHSLSLHFTVSHKVKTTRTINKRPSTQFTGTIS